ncbi:MAG: sensor domain-containing diguanylate cyclase [Xylophilus ampelinus]
MAHFENTVLPQAFESPGPRAADAGAFGADAPPARWNTVRRTKLLVYGICAVLLALDLGFVALSWVYTRRQVVFASANLSQSVSQQVNASLLDVQHVLDDVVFEIERSGLTPAAMERLRPALVNKTTKVDQIKGLFVYDAAGRWLASSQTKRLQSFNNADRDYFIHHRQSQSLDTQISSPVVSRSSGEWVIPMSRRLNDEQGRFIGVAIATVRLDYFRRMIEKIDVGAEGALSLTLHGKLMLRKPYVEGFINKEVSESPMVRMAASQAAGLSEQRSPYDGVTRLMNFSHPQDYPIVVTIAMGKDEAFREWRRVAFSLSAILLLLCGAALLAGRQLVASLRLREEAEAKAVEARRALDAANRKLRHLAYNDGLTGVPNRRYFDTRLRRNFRTAQRHGRPIAVAMIDVDEFKRYNDDHGHAAGDACLRQVAGILREAVRGPEDAIARYGGEEFVMLLPDTGPDGAMRVAEAARAAVHAAAIPHPASAHRRVTVSVGVASLVPGPSCDPGRILKAADEALYRAKLQGRNAVAPADPARLRAAAPEG